MTALQAGLLEGDVKDQLHERATRDLWAACCVLIDLHVEQHFPVSERERWPLSRDPRLDPSEPLEYPPGYRSYLLEWASRRVFSAYADLAEAAR